MSRKRHYCLPTLLCATAVVILVLSSHASVHGGAMPSTSAPFFRSTTSNRVHDSSYYSLQIAAENRRRRTTAAVTPSTDDAVRRSSTETAATAAQTMRAKPTIELAMEDVSRDSKTADTVLSADDGGDTVSTCTDDNKRKTTTDAFRCYKIKYTTPKTTTKRWSPKLKKCNTQSASNRRTTADYSPETATTKSSEVVDNNYSNEIREDIDCTEYPSCNPVAENACGDTETAVLKASKSPSGQINQINVVGPKDWTVVPPRYRKPPPSPATGAAGPEQRLNATATQPTRPTVPPPTLPQQTTVKPRRKTRTSSTDRHAGTESDR